MNWENTLNYLETLWLEPMVRGAILCLGWLFVGYIGSRIVRKFFTQLARIQKLPMQILGLLQKMVKAVVWFLCIMLALSACGIDITSVLGAAGVMGVAIGFASQTSLSNLICGVFLVSERSVKIGDYISVEGVEGTVESINLLSVWLRKIDNSLVRVPNQSLIQSPMTNITGSEMRRCDFEIGVAYDSDLEQVRACLLKVIEQEELFLADPAPGVFFLNFADSSLNLRVGAWCKTADYHALRFQFASKILAAFKAEGIEIPFPCRTLLMQQAAA